MSRARRDRQKRPAPWCCLGCGAAMQQSRAAATSRLAARIREAAGRPVATMVHVCGACRAFHVEDGVGGLRQLSAAEEFALRVEYARGVAAAEAAPPDTLIVTEE